MCDQTSKKFLPGGVHDRPNALCEWCGSSERHRLLWPLLKRRTDLFTRAGIKVLYFAPEYFVTDLLRKSTDIDLTTTDLFRDDVDIQADIQALPFEDSYFDAIICSHVLEHVPDDTAAMRELRRVLKPTGWAVISVPRSPGRKTTYEDASITDPAERLKHFGQDDHLRIYGEDFAGMLSAAGFAVTNVTAADLELQDTARYGIPRDYHLPLCLPI